VVMMDRAVVPPIRQRLRTSRLYTHLPGSLPRLRVVRVTFRVTFADIPAHWHSPGARVLARALSAPPLRPHPRRKTPDGVQVDLSLGGATLPGDA
jgi:hypothetical protein